MNGVVPFPVEGLRYQTNISHLLVRDPLALGIGFLIESALYRQPRPGRGGRNQLDDDLMSYQGLAAPVLGDERKEAMLDFVPLTRPRR